MLDMSDMFDMRDIYSDDYVFSLDENGVFTALYRTGRQNI